MIYKSLTKTRADAPAHLSMLRLLVSPGHPSNEYFSIVISFQLIIQPSQ